MLCCKSTSPHGPMRSTSCRKRSLGYPTPSCSRGCGSSYERGNAVEAELLAHLGEVDARQLYLEEGCSSMFTYCQRVLHFAEGVAYKRIQAARAARRHPQILAAVRCGDLHLTAVGLARAEAHCEQLRRADPRGSTSRRGRDRDSCSPTASQSPRSADVQCAGFHEPARQAPAASSRHPPCRSRVPQPPAAPRPPSPPATNRAARGRALPRAVHGRRRDCTRSSRSCARSCGIRSRTATSGRSSPRQLLFCSNRCASSKFAEHLERPGRHGPPLSERSDLDDIFQPRSGAPSGNATRGRCTYVSAGGRRCDSKEFVEFDHADALDVDESALDRGDHAALSRAQSAASAPGLRRATHGPSSGELDLNPVHRKRRRSSHSRSALQGQRRGWQPEVTFLQSQAARREPPRQAGVASIISAVSHPCLSIRTRTPFAPRRTRDSSSRARTTSPSATCRRSWGLTCAGGVLSTSAVERAARHAFCAARVSL